MKDLSTNIPKISQNVIIQQIWLSYFKFQFLPSPF